MRTIAGILVRELERKLPEKEEENYQQLFELYKRVLKQQPKDKNKIYRRPPAVIVGMPASLHARF